MEGVRDLRGVLDDSAREVCETLAGWSSLPELISNQVSAFLGRQTGEEQQDGGEPG